VGETIQQGDLLGGGLGAGAEVWDPGAHWRFQLKPALFDQPNDRRGGEHGRQGADRQERVFRERERGVEIGDAEPRGPCPSPGDKPDRRAGNAVALHAIPELVEQFAEVEVERRAGGWAE
jgi:hypothetical protein